MRFSLPEATLQRFFKLESEKQTFSNLGLNIVPPLVQGAHLSPLLKNVYNQPIQNSPDPEIRAWTKGREAENRGKDKSLREPSQRMGKEGYIRAVENAINDSNWKGIAFDWKNMLVLPRSSVEIKPQLIYCEEAIRNYTGNDVLLANPFGTLSARVCLILDHDLTSVCWPMPISESREVSTDLPLFLKEAGFTEFNCVIWRYSHRNYLSVDLTNGIKPAVLSEASQLNQLSRNLINSSNVKIVLLCGPNAARNILGSSGFVGPLKFNLGKYRFIMYLETEVSRIYIESPEILTQLSGENWRDAQRLGEILRFTKVLANVPEIRPNIFESGLVIAYILRKAYNENNGEDAMTLETMHPGIQAWLYRNGFKNEDLAKLEKAGGTMTTSLLMVLNCLHAQKMERPIAPPLPRYPQKRAKSKAHFDLEYLTR